MENESFLACPACRTVGNLAASSATHAAPFGSRQWGLPGQLGEYEILDEVARGGMGIVYRARQPRLNRFVALKVMLPGVLSSPAQVQRFNAEAQIVASLNHPNIISVYEIGEDDGTYFFSMPFVRGVDLGRKGRVESQTAARYLEKVAEAVYHAHQRGVLHRDLKPSNILIDEADEPRVVDFGIAKATADNLGLTQTGESLGTPSYMAPEQVHPDGHGISVATDIYALGGILYFLLAGRPPFGGSTRDQVLWSVFYDEPARPADINPAIPRDLETIALKCLAKDPAQRYATAGDLAEDLRHFLNHEPISARPVSTAQRTWMWAKRNPALALCASALLAAVIYGITAQQLALSKARKARADAEKLIDFMDKELTQKVRPLGRLDLTAEVLRKAEAYFRDQDESKAEPAFLLRKASFFWRTGGLQRDLGRFSEAEHMALKGLATLDRFPKGDSLNAQAFGLRANLEFLLFRTSENLGKISEARDYARRAVEDQRRAAELSPSDPKAAASLAETLMETSPFYRREKEAEKAESHLKEASERLEPLAAQNPTDLEIRRLLAITHYHKGLALQENNDNANAAREFALFVQGLESISQAAANDHDWQHELGVAYGRAASVYYALGMSEATENLVEKWRHSARTLADFDPHNAAWRVSLAQSLAWSGLLARDRSKTDPDVRSCFREALEIYQQLSVHDPNADHYFDSIDEMTANLAGYYKAANQMGEAEELLRSSVERHFDHASRFVSQFREHRRLANACDNLIQFLQKQGRADEAAVLSSKWLGDLQNRFGDAPAPYYWHWTDAAIHGWLADFAVANRKYENAVEEWKKNLSGLKEAEGWHVHDCAEDLAYAWQSLVSTHAKRKDLEAVISAAGETLDWLDRQPAKPMRLTVEVSSFIASKALSLDDGSGRVDQLVARCRRRFQSNPPALEKFDGSVPASNPKAQETPSPNTANAQPPRTTG